MIYAADTSTSVEKTRAELETVIGKFGAGAFGYAMQDGAAMIQLLTLRTKLHPTFNRST